MEKTLVDAVHEAIEALQLAASQAAKVKQTMRKQRLSFGLEFNQIDDDIAQIIRRLQYMERLALRHTPVE
ncbi:MAG TPA: hypothetical protein VGF38_15355 [Ktedonobacterales bacterium]|jgi:hypothetical protein